MERTAGGIIDAIEEFLRRKPDADDHGYWCHAQSTLNVAHEVLLHQNCVEDRGNLQTANALLATERLSMRFEDLLKSCQTRDYEGMLLDWARVKAVLPQGNR